MSDEDEITEEELEELERISSVYSKAVDLCTYTVTMMNLNKMGIACDDNRIAYTFLEKVKEILEVHTGEHGTIKFEFTPEVADDSASGSSEVDNGEEGGELRPSDRKLH